MRFAIYLTHPEVAIDPAVPVPQWGLSRLGRARTEGLAAKPWLRKVDRIVSSEERKAIETAQILGAARGLPVESRPGLQENDRSATGYLPAPEFEAMATQFFAEPERSINGWERAVDAQARIIGAVASALDERPDTVLTLFVGHGGVGTLLRCHCAGLAIDRRHDQKGAGHWFAFHRAALQGTDALPATAWQPMENEPSTLGG